MKKLLLSPIVLLVFALAANAQTAPAPATTPAASTTAAQDTKIEIKLEELPQPVKTTLATDAYKGWAVVKVWKNESKDSYEIEAKNAAETKTLKFDKEGKEIKS